MAAIKKTIRAGRETALEEHGNLNPALQGQDASEAASDTPSRSGASAGQSLGRVRALRLQPKARNGRNRVPPAEAARPASGTRPRRGQEPGFFRARLWTSAEATRTNGGWNAGVDTPSKTDNSCDSKIL